MTTRDASHVGQCDHFKRLHSSKHRKHIQVGVAALPSKCLVKCQLRLPAQDKWVTVWESRHNMCSKNMLAASPPYRSTAGSQHWTKCWYQHKDSADPYCLVHCLTCAQAARLAKCPAESPTRALGIWQAQICTQSPRGPKEKARNKTQITHQSMQMAPGTKSMA